MTGRVGRPSDPARIALVAYLDRQTEALRTAGQGVRDDADDAVHQMRVAARRLRSGLRVFRPMLDREWADGLREELAWVAGELGRFRDGEVLLGRLDRNLPRAAEPARKLLDERMSGEVAQARGKALEALDSARYSALVSALERARTDPVVTPAAGEPAGRALPPLVARAWRRLDAAAWRVLAEEEIGPAGAPDEDWHRTRIRAKRARYAAEAVAPVLGQDAKRLANRLSRVTDLLGDHQDAVQAATVAEELAADAEPDLAFALGVLSGVERAHAARVRRKFGKIWPTVDRKKLRRWFEA